MTAHLVEWFNTLPTAVLLMSTLFGVGWCVLRAAGMRGLRALSLAPAVSALVLGGDGVVLAWIGRPFGWAPVLLTTTVVAAALWCLRRAMDRWDPGILRQPDEPQSGMSSRTQGGRVERRLVLAAVATWVVSAVPVVATITPMAVSQSGDSLYHYAQVALIERTDLASMLTPNAGMFGLTSHSSYYPVVWHEIAALGAWSWQETLTTNNVLLLAVALVWYLGVVYLARTVLTDVPAAPYLALGAGMIVPVFPWRLTYDAALWPYCLAMSICPAVMALGVECVRRCRTLKVVGDGRGASVKACLAVGAWVPFLVGVMLIHPSALVVVGWPAAALAWGWVVREGLRARQAGQGRRAAWLLGGAALVVVIGVLFVVGPGPQQAHFSRRPARTWSDALGKVLTSLSLYYGGAGTGMNVLALVVLLLLALGAGVALLGRRHLGLLAAWASCPPLLLGALAPVPVLSPLTGLFYNNPHRIKAMTVPLVLLLLVIALDAIRRKAVPWLERLIARSRRVSTAHAQGAARGTVVVIASLGALAGLVVSGGATASDVRQGYVPVPGSTRFIVDDAEVAMIRRLPEELPQSAIVLGDPSAGAGYIPILTGLRSVWAFAGQSSDDTDGIYLRDHFKEVHEDPKVCEILVRHGISYFYQDADSMFNGVLLSSRRPGTYGVDTSEGFTLIDAGGSASVWRIDLCQGG